MSKCRLCGEKIVWVKTPKRTYSKFYTGYKVIKGKAMPVDAGTVVPGETKFNHRMHLSHFSTCKQANKWRKKNVKKDHSVD